MAEPPDIDQLAKQYLDLWQDHLKTMAADPQVAETMSQVTQMMTGSATAFAAMAGQAMKTQTANKDTDSHPHDQRTDDDHDAAAQDARTTRTHGPGAAADAAAHGGADIDMAKLARRLDGIERRLAALEAGAGGTGKGAGKGARKRQS